MSGRTWRNPWIHICSAVVLIAACLGLPYLLLWDLYSPRHLVMFDVALTPAADGQSASQEIDFVLPRGTYVLCVDVPMPTKGEDVTALVASKLILEPPQGQREELSENQEIKIDGKYAQNPDAMTDAEPPQPLIPFQRGTDRIMPFPMSIESVGGNSRDLVCLGGNFHISQHATHGRATITVQAPEGKALPPEAWRVRVQRFIDAV